VKLEQEKEQPSSATAKKGSTPKGKTLSAHTKTKVASNGIWYSIGLF